MGLFICFFLFLFSVRSIGSMCTLVTALITLNRALAIWNSKIAEKYFTWKITLVYYTRLWISLVFLSLPTFNVWGKSKYYKTTFSCTYDQEIPLKKTFISISFATIVIVLISSSVAMKRFMNWSTNRVSFHCGDVPQELMDAISAK